MDQTFNFWYTRYASCSSRLHQLRCFNVFILVCEKSLQYILNSLSAFDCPIFIMRWFKRNSCFYYFMIWHTNAFPLIQFLRIHVVLPNRVRATFACLNISLTLRSVCWYCMYHHIDSYSDFLFFPIQPYQFIIRLFVHMSVCMCHPFWEWLSFKVWVVKTSDHFVGVECNRLCWSFYSWRALVIVHPSRKHSVFQEASK